MDQSLEQLHIISILWCRNHCNPNIDITLLQQNLLDRRIPKVDLRRRLPRHSVAFG